MPETNSPRHTFVKKERLCSKRIIDTLFGGGSKSFSAYPLRAVFRPIEEFSDSENELVSVLVSVSKKHFKRAVKRNRAKRQIREAYRKNKEILYLTIRNNSSIPKQFALAFLWQADELLPSWVVENKMKNLLSRIAEQISKEYPNHEKDMENN